MSFDSLLELSLICSLQRDAQVRAAAADGRTVLYSTYLTGASLVSYAPGLALDGQGNPVVGGYTNARLPVRGAVQPNFGGGPQDGFVTKVNAAGTDLIYSTYLGGVGTDQVWALACAKDGTVYAAGLTNDGGFPQKDSVQPYRRGQDSFVTAISPNGDRLIYSSLLGGTGNESYATIALDGQGNAYVAGATGSRDFPTKGAFQKDAPDFSNPNGAAAYLYRLRPVSSEPTTLQLSTSVVSFIGSVNGPAPATQSMVVTATGGSAAPFTVTTNANGGSWLTVTPLAGSTPTTLTLRADPAGLTSGQYQASVIITPQGGVPASVSVSLRIYAPAATLLSVTPATVRQHSPDTDFLLTGENIANGATVAILLPFSLPLPVTVVNSNTLRVTVASQYLANSGTLSLSITNPGAQPSALGNVIVIPLLPFIRDGGIVNSAALKGTAIAPGELITILGADLIAGEAAKADFDVSGHLPRILKGARVLLDGRPAPLLSVSSAQIQAIAPYTIAQSTSVQLQLELNGQQTVRVSVPVVASSPGIFTVDGKGDGAAAVINDTFTFNSPDNPAEPDSVVMIFVTGAGLMDAPREDGSLVTTIAHPVSTVTAEIDGQEAEVLFAGTVPGLIEGVVEVDLRIPPGASGSNVPVTIRVGSAVSQPNVTLSLR